MRMSKYILSYRCKRLESGLELKGKYIFCIRSFNLYDAFHFNKDIENLSFIFDNHTRNEVLISKQMITVTERKIN